MTRVSQPVDVAQVPVLGQLNGSNVFAERICPGELRLDNGLPALVDIAPAQLSIHNRPYREQSRGRHHGIISRHRGGGFAAAAQQCHGDCQYRSPNA